MTGEHHHPALFDDQRWAVAGAVTLYVAAGAVMLAMAVAESSIQPIDDSWLDAMVAIESGPLTFVGKVFNLVGSTWFTLPVRVAVAAFLWSRRRMEWLTVWMASALIAELSVGPLKALYGRPRPLDPLVETSGASFPSGHAVAGAVTAVALVIVFLPAGAHRRMWEVAAGVFAFFMAMSRTYLRAHWLFDVIAGTLLGAAAAVAVAAVVHSWWVRNRAPSLDGSGDG